MAATGRAAEGQPQLGVLLPRLCPPELEAKFWESNAYRRWSTEVDAVNIALRLLEVLLACRIWQDLPNLGVDASRLYRVCWNVTALAALHLSLRLLMCDMYQWLRLLLAVHMRIYLMLVAIFITREVRRMTLRHPTLISQIISNSSTQESGDADLTDPYLFCRFLLVGTLAFRSCLHALPPTLPFALTLAIQLTYLAAIYHMMAIPFTHLFAHQAFLPHAQRACRTLSRTLVLPLPPPPHPPAAVCHTRQVAWVVALFAQLFVGCVLPLYITYITERRLKLAFLQQHLAAAAATATPPARTIPTTNTLTPPTSAATSSPAITATPPTASPSSPPPSPMPPSTRGTPHIPPSPPTVSRGPAPTPQGAATTPQGNTARPHAILSWVPAKHPTHHMNAACEVPGTSHRDGGLGNGVAGGTGHLGTAGGALRDHSGRRLPLHVVQLAGITRQRWERLVNALAADYDNTCCYGRCIAFVCRRCFDAAALWALAAVSWQLVLAAHVPILQYARPLDYVGGDKRWYWELLCSSDQPCCPAL